MVNMVGKEMFKHSCCEHESIAKDRTFGTRELHYTAVHGNVDAEKCIYMRPKMSKRFFILAKI